MRWPVEHPRATPNGRWGTERITAAQGACGVGKHPCVHSGLDLAGAAGTRVYAPEDLSIDSVATGALPPFRGYGPGVMLARGKQTGFYHLFAHLEYGSIPSAKVPGDWLDDLRTIGPVWDRDSSQRRQLRAGELVGVTSSANHSHWEVRSSAHGARTSPARWIQRHVDPDVELALYEASGAAATMGDGWGLLLLIGLYAYDQRGRRR